MAHDKFSMLAVAIAATLLSGCATQSASPIDDVSTQDGLVKAEVKGVDAVYRRPSANLTEYNRILLEPLEVAFSKNWNPEKDSALYKMHKPDREKIKSELAELFRTTFEEVLSEQGGYTLVSEPDKDVLQLRAAIVNLYITAPDVSMDVAGRSRTYTADAGEMTLIAELRDSVTGQLLSRAYDRREDSGGTWQWTNSVSNTADAKREIRRWAELLKKSLDASRGKTA
jgi:hypothetical protein